MKKILALLNGKKTVIASMYWGAVMPSLLVLFPQGVPADVNKWCTIVGFFLTAAGLGHKWYKSATEKE